MTIQPPAFQPRFIESDDVDGGHLPLPIYVSRNADNAKAKAVLRQAMAKTPPSDTASNAIATTEHD